MSFQINIMRKLTTTNLTSKLGLLAALVPKVSFQTLVIFVFSSALITHKSLEAAEIDKSKTKICNKKKIDYCHNNITHLGFIEKRTVTMR